MSKIKQRYFKSNLKLQQQSLFVFLLETFAAYFFCLRFLANESFCFSRFVEGKVGVCIIKLNGHVSLAETKIHKSPVGSFGSRNYPYNLLMKLNHNFYQDSRRAHASWGQGFESRRMLGFSLFLLIQHKKITIFIESTTSYRRFHLIFAIKIFRKKCMNGFYYQVCNDMQPRNFTIHTPEKKIVTWAIA